MKLLRHQLLKNGKKSPEKTWDLMNFNKFKKDVRSQMSDDYQLKGTARKKIHMCLHAEILLEALQSNEPGASRPGGVRWMLNMVPMPVCTKKEKCCQNQNNLQNLFMVKSKLQYNQ